MSFESNKASGYDGVPMAVVQDFIGIISRPLSHIINLSILNGIVPDEMKIARVIPLFKSGDQAVVTNYRPVSILPCFSKFLEKVIYKHLLNYINDLGIFCNNKTPAQALTPPA